MKTILMIILLFFTVLLIAESNKELGKTEVITFKKKELIKKEKKIKKNKKNDVKKDVKKKRDIKIAKELERENKESKSEIIIDKKENKKVTVRDILIDIFSDLDFLDTKISFTLLNNLGKSILSMNPDLSLNQASVSKVIITLASMKYLGLNYRFKTEFYIDGKIDKKGVLKGDLIVKGYGDPNLLVSDLYKIIDYFTLKGLKKIDGNLIIDLSYFDKRHSLYSLEVEDHSRSYAADNSALPLDYNSFKFSIKGKETLKENPDVNISYPAKYFIKIKNKLISSKRYSRYKLKTKSKKWKKTELELKGRVKLNSEAKIYYRKIRNVDYYFGNIFYKLLRLKGIRVTKKLKIRYDDQLKRRKDAELYYSHYTKYLFDTLIIMNRYSNNFIAEQLLKIIGAETSETYPKKGTFEFGLSAVKKMLKEDIKIDDNYRYETASGLNEANFFSSYQIAKILHYVKSNFDYKWYLLSTLPKIGVSGTLKKYCLNEDCKGVLLAKTGTLRTTIALAGFIKGKKEIYTFSLSVNFKRSKKKRNAILKKSKRLFSDMIDLEEL